MSKNDIDLSMLSDAEREEYEEMMEEADDLDADAERLREEADEAEEDASDLRKSAQRVFKAAEDRKKQGLIGNYDRDIAVLRDGLPKRVVEEGLAILCATAPAIGASPAPEKK